MRNSAELKNLAWKRLWEDHWFGRLFGGGILLGLCGYAVNLVIGGILGELNVRTWSDYYMAVIQNRQDLTTPIPNLTQEFVSQASSSMVLSMFVGYIMAGIAAYGTAVILLRCLKDDEKGWLGAAFGGFKDPFGMLWLFVRYVLVFVGWGLFLVIPPLGIWLLIVAFYRYRFLFLVKAEHPDWSAGQCLRSCRTLMRGHKMDSFHLDCAYWKPITLMLLLLMAGACFAALVAVGVLPLVNGFAAGITCLGACAASVVIKQYISVGQGFLYLDIGDAAQESQD